MRNEPKAGKENKALAYFMNMRSKLPTEKELTAWPLTFDSFELDYKRRPEKIKPMQPKETKHIETYVDYYVSPRKFIRYGHNQGRDFTYSDNFQI
jgi:hypothetical protein